ncbi:MAG TPA: biosynthetic peptidoglycan transglycosylase, partial [Chloroflexota bacterium]|nr:biosynthetic peptidoglycan transglycosylase [Chloroflexota bacterium]
MGVVGLIVLLTVGGVCFLARLPDVGDAEARVAALLRAHHGIDSGLAIPTRLAQSIVAVEDERFYAHHGIDMLGLLRAGQVDLLHQSMREGGSTITQQLAKVLYVRDDHSLGAKLQMIGLALKLERRYSKAEILEMYLTAI